MRVVKYWKEVIPGPWGGILAFVIALERKPRIGLESKSNGGSQGKRSRHECGE